MKTKTGEQRSAKVIAFLKEIVELQATYDLCLGHGDNMTPFTVYHEYDDSFGEWLLEAKEMEEDEEPA